MSKTMHLSSSVKISLIQISKQLSRPVNRRTMIRQHSAEWSSVRCWIWLHLGLIQLIQLNLEDDIISSHQTGVTVMLVRAKSDSSYKLKILDARVCMANRMVNFLSPGFSHNFTENI